LQLTDKPVPSARHGLDIARFSGRFSERFPQLVYGGIQAVFELHERLGRPELSAYFFSQNHFARVFQQEVENFGGLASNPDPQGAFSQLPCSGVELEFPKASSRRLDRSLHSG